MAVNINPMSVFSYGTLRGDCGDDGDQWGLLRETAGSWRHGSVKGFQLYQQSNKPYPFVVKNGNPCDVVIGTLLEWPDVQAGQAALARCDRIEGCDPQRPETSLYQRCVVEVHVFGDGVASIVSAWIYFQSMPSDRSCVRHIEHGDWLSRNQREANEAADNGEKTEQCDTKPVFTTWLRGRLAAGDSAAALVQCIGADCYLQAATSDQDLILMLEAFAVKVGGKACESIRKVAMQSKAVPGIPFSLWLQERWANNATARQVLGLLGLPTSKDAIKTEEELWNGLWELSKEEGAWTIIVEMARGPLSEMPPRKGCCTTVDSFEEVAALIEKSTRILVLSGAGISASCGIPTFRDSGGFYDTIAKEYGLADAQDVNDINTFRRNPLPWFKHVRAIVPNSATPRVPSLTHRFMRSLEARGKLLWQYTQNIDCLEAVAGVSRVTCCHGSFASATCVKCGYHLSDGKQVNDTIADDRIPYCEGCGEGVMKPDVVLFNEPMPKGVSDGIQQHTDEADLLLVLGTSLNVAPCSLIPSLVGASGDAPRVLINAEIAGRSTDFEHFLEGPSDRTVQQLIDIMRWTAV